MGRSVNAFLLLFSCMAGIRPEKAVDPGREKAALMRVDMEFSEAAQKLGVGEAFARYADENATMMPAGENPVVGPTAIRRQFADFPKGAILVWKPFKADVSAAGDLGYTLGTYEYVARDADGKPATRYGKYCSVWRKQAGQKLEVGRRHRQLEPGSETVAGIFATTRVESHPTRMAASSPSRPLSSLPTRSPVRCVETSRARCRR